MSPYSDIAYIHIDGNKCLCHYESVTEFTKKCQRQSKATVPPPMTFLIITHETCHVQVQLFKFLLKAKLFILHCTKFCDDINCAIVLAWFKYILVFTHVDVIP